METEPFDPASVLDVCRSILRRSGHEFPERLAKPVIAALDDASTRADMLVQLLMLCNGGTRDIYRGAQFVDGRLLYTNGVSYVVWGTREFAVEDGFSMKAGSMILVGNKPCWIETSHSTSEERVNWAGRAGALYPEHAVESLTDRSGVPCYAVNANVGDDPVGFVVLDESEGKRFRRVERLAVVSGDPLYVGTVSYRRAALMWGPTTVCEGYNVGRIAILGGIPYAALRLREDSRESQLRRGFEVALECAELSGPSIVGGKLAYAEDTGRGFVSVSVGGESRKIDGSVLDWFAPDADNPAVVYTIRDGDSLRLYANHTELCPGRPQPNAVRILDDGITLRVLLEGEREPRTFNLKALGIL